MSKATKAVGSRTPFTLSDLADVLQGLEPGRRKTLNRVFVTHLVPDGRVVRCSAEGWLLISPRSYGDIEKEARSPTPAERAWGIPIEHVPGGSDRERKIARTILESAGYGPPDSDPRDTGEDG